MQQGVIKEVDFNRGLGHVLSNDGKEIVLITKGLEDKLVQGARIMFEIKQTRRGIIAINIKPTAANAH